MRRPSVTPIVVAAGTAALTVACLSGSAPALSGRVTVLGHDASAVAAASDPRAGAARVIVRRGRRGYRGRRGRTGPAGPPGHSGAPGTDHAFNLTINWRGEAAAPGRDTASVAIAGIGTLTAVCSPATQTLTLTPASAGVRTAANVSDFESSSASNEQPYSETTSPILIGSSSQPGKALPPNGMIVATLSVEPIAGNGGPGPAPATLTLSSEYKVNDPDQTKDFCFIAGQLIAGS